MAVWGLWRYIRKQNVDSSYWGALVIAEVLYLAQGGLGAYLFLSGIGVLQRSIHILYGVVGVLVLPSIFAFTRGQDERRSMLVYGVGFLFLVGIVLRAITTAG
jgi:hypothetical protein